MVWAEMIALLVPSKRTTVTVMLTAEAAVLQKLAARMMALAARAGTKGAEVRPRVTPSCRTTGVKAIGLHRLG